MEPEVYDNLYRLEDDHWWFRGRRAVIAALLARSGVTAGPGGDPDAGGQRRRLLDAGCGTGRNLVELARLGEASGADVSPQAVDYCHRRGFSEVVRSGLEQLPFADGTFDVTLMADVVEHVADDVVALRELRRVAAPSGLLVITTPAYMWLWSHQDETHHHHRRYTRPLLAERVRAAGWEPEISTHFNAALLGPIALVRKLGRRFIPADRSDTELTPGPLNTVLEWPMRAEAGLIRAGASIPFGVSIAMTCRPAEV